MTIKEYIKFSRPLIILNIVAIIISPIFDIPRDMMGLIFAPFDILWIGFIILSLKNGI